MLVIDTNVLFAAVCPKDPTHERALSFLSANTEELFAPQILKVELMSLLARKFDLAVAELYYKELTASITFEDNASVDVLIEYVKHKKVRGCDSFFAYLSDHLGAKIVSFDKDLTSKTAGIFLL